MDYTVESVRKALHLLFMVADQPGLGVTELARRSGMTKARSFRLLETMEQYGMIKRDGQAAIYCLSHRVLSLGAFASRQLKLADLSKKYLPKVGHRIDESVHVHLREGVERICIARWNTKRSIGIHTKIGSRQLLHAGATGKLLLAFAPTSVFDDVLTEDLERYTDRTLTRREELCAELSRIRSQGYSLSNGEVVSGTVAIAVPLIDSTGVVAALGASIPSSRATEGVVTDVLEVLRQAADEFSVELRQTSDDEAHVSAKRVL
ncbi:IclR family transcriptional regulator [Herbaspirillum sp. GCM10030257]|uniref:IclR family transcriptional regulator n=1 Tax=Herbaspirillum sp. GCM10030257 TaxID=3273393 RepID=UPI0036224E62